MVDKIMTAQQAVKKYVNNSDMVFVGGFGHAIPFSIAQEIVRQKKYGLHLIKTGADIVFDMLVASGCAQRLTCGWYGNPGMGMSNVIRQAVESDTLELIESTNFSMMLRLHAGKLGVPFIPSPILSDGDLAHTVSGIKSIKCPFTDAEIQAHGSLNPDVAIVHAQRSDVNGNVQLWGSIGDTVDGCEASKKLFVPLKRFAEMMKLLLCLILQNYQHTKLLPSLSNPLGPILPIYMVSIKEMKNIMQTIVSIPKML